MITETTTQKDLRSKIELRTLRAGIIGLGYVGLPLAVEFAKEGVEVVGIDIDSAKINAIMRGESYVGDVPSDDIRELIRVGHGEGVTRGLGESPRRPITASGGLRATTDFSVIKELDTVNICVPTPLRKSKDPDISYIVAATEEIVKYLHPGMLIILESTTYPGTTTEVILPMLEKTGLKVGKDFYLAFSPERVDPGNPKYQTRNIPKVVGGVTEDCTKLAAAFYAIAIENVHTVSSPSSAEMVKLLENTFRSVNIGLVNELCQMSAKLGVDVWEIIDAAATKPFGFMPFYPGPGLGGHCIPIDPHYLAWKARIHGANPRFIDLAGVVNAEMPEYVVRKAQEILNQRGRAMNGSRILVFGVTYKKNISDVRESPALEIIELLEKHGAEVSYTDPYVPELTLHGKTYSAIDTAKGRTGDTVNDRSAASPSHRFTASMSFDLSILVTDHNVFEREAILKSAPVVLDTRNMFKGVKNERIFRI